MVSPRSEIVLNQEVQSVLVGFRDEDGDALFFTWILDGNTAAAQDVTTFSDVNDPLLTFSTFRARRDALAEVSEVQVIITDGEDASRITWRVVQP